MLTSPTWGLRSDAHGEATVKKVDPAAMRQANRSILIDALRKGVEMSRSDVARRTTLAKPTVSAIVEQLIEEGIVREVGLGEATPTGGRRPRLLRYEARSEAYCGIQVGVTNTTVAVADGTGELLTVRSVRTVKRSPQKSIADIKRLVSKTVTDAGVARSHLRAAAVIVPGLVERDTGICVLAPNLGWRNVHLKSQLAKALVLPLTVENTTRAAAVAEGRIGAAVGVDSYVWVYAGTGIGATAVIDGKPFYGHQGFSGEIGHCPVLDEGPLCGCGRSGCLETVASADAVARQAKEAIDAGRRTVLAKARRTVDATQVAHAAQQGDRVATVILEKAGDFLGKGISYLLNVLNPQLVVVGGPLALAGELLLEPIRASVDKHALPQVEVEIAASVLDGEAEVRGAVFLAMGLRAEAPVAASG